MKKTITNNTKGFIVLTMTLIMLLALMVCSTSEANNTISATSASKSCVNINKTTYGTVDWSTAANGYITFTAKGQERCFILQGPNNNKAMFTVARGDSIKIALTDGTGKYQYAIANAQSSNNTYIIQYKNSFNVSENESK